MPPTTFNKFNLKSFGLLIGYSVLMMFIALYNGFPLVENDTGAYIQLAFHLQIPADRTPFYGIFLGITSLHDVLWLTIFAQSLLLCYLLRRYIAYLYPDVDMFSEMFCFIIIISFTCVSWVVSYLMPDIFAGILLLAVLLYLFDASASVMQRYGYIAIIFVAVIIHNSHFLILTIFSTLFIIHSLLSKQRGLLIKCIVLICISISFWTGMCSLNYYKGHGFTFSRAGHVFMVAKFAETDILATYLYDNCGKKNLKLCAYQDQIPTYPGGFLWFPTSPLYKTGGWDSSRAEYNYIIHDVFTTPKYLKMFIENSLISTFKEIILVHAPEGTSQLGKNDEPWKQIDHYYHDELSEYSISHQSSEGAGAGVGNTVYYLFFILSSLWVLFFRRILSKNLSEIYLSLLLFFIINAFVTSVFSMVHYRFQYRIFWILPATNAIVIARYYFHKHRKMFVEIIN